MTLSFEKISLQHVDIIFDWLAEPFIQEFWDNTQGHKDDILNFVNGRKEPSNYCLKAFLGTLCKALAVNIYIPALRSRQPIYCILLLRTTPLLMAINALEHSCLFGFYN